MWLTSNRPAFVAGPQMLGDDAFILDRHLIAGERHHPGAVGAVPGVERERLPGLSVGSSAPRLGSISLRASRDSGDSRRPPGFGHRPRLSLGPESFPRLSLGPESFTPSAARLPRRRTLSRLSGARGPWCLRDSGGGCSFGAAIARGNGELSRAAFRKSSLPETGGALAPRRDRVNAADAWHRMRRSVNRLIIAWIRERGGNHAIMKFTLLAAATAAMLPRRPRPTPSANGWTSRRRSRPPPRRRRRRRGCPTTTGRRPRSRSPCSRR